MMGAPLTAGAVSKTWLMEGAELAGQSWGIWVLWASSLLNAAYFLPILWRAWVRPAPATWPDEHIRTKGFRESAWLLLIPPVITAVAVLMAGIFSEADWSPLSWARLIADREYLR